MPPVTDSGKLKEAQRLEIALRLKSARFLLGTRNAKGQAVAISTADLARLPVLAENRVTRNRIEDIEQMKVDARPYELEKIAAAVGLPTEWFGTAAAPDDLSAAMEGVLHVLTSDAQERRRAQGASAGGPGVESRRRPEGEGAAG